MINIHIDSNVIVASEIKTEIHHKESKQFMEYVLRNDIKSIIFSTSVFTFLELASAMIRRTKDKDKVYSLLYRIRNSWKDSIKPLPPMPPKKITSITRLVDHLVETSVRFRTPAADTFHAQTIYAFNTDYLITWNKKDFLYMKKHIKTLKILTPIEVLKELKKIKFRGQNNYEKFFTYFSSIRNKVAHGKL